jgi:hypothetical protein
MKSHESDGGGRMGSSSKHRHLYKYICCPHAHLLVELSLPQKKEEIEDVKFLHWEISGVK